AGSRSTTRGRVCARLRPRGSARSVGSVARASPCDFQPQHVLPLERRARRRRRADRGWCESKRPGTLVPRGLTRGRCALRVLYELACTPADLCGPSADHVAERVLATDATLRVTRAQLHLRVWSPTH